MNTWKTFQGKDVSYDTIDQQHLSNCYWFLKVIEDAPADDIRFTMITNALAHRFNGQLLSYRPHIDFTYEIDILKKKDMLCWKDSLLNQLYIRNFDGSIIGEIYYPPGKKIALDIPGK